LDKLELRKKVGMVFQQYNLFPHKTALENVMMAPVRVLKQNKADAEAAAHALIKKCALKVRKILILASFRVANNSVLRLPVHWRCTLMSSCLMR
jgi:ABC-type histidine transport system ATPase subunit